MKFHRLTPSAGSTVHGMDATTWTPEQVARRMARARDATVAAADDLGIVSSQPRVLHDMFSVVVHLAPEPLVARVPTVLPPAAELPEILARQRTELDVASWLGERGHPVTSPSPLVPKEPVERDGFAMTFWEFVEQREIEPDFVRNSALSAELHQALRDYPGELGFLTCLAPSIPEVEEILAARPDLLKADDLDRARRQWEALTPVVGSREGFTAAFPGVEMQPIHGDSPPFNIASTERGALYSDLETVTLGPVEWDLTLAGAECEAAYDAAAHGLGMRTLDKRVQRVMNSARQLQLLACLSMAPQLPMLGDALQPMVEQWRQTPFEGVPG